MCLFLVDVNGPWRTLAHVAQQRSRAHRSPDGPSTSDRAKPRVQRLKRRPSPHCWSRSEIGGVASMSGDCSSSRASIDRPDSASGYAMAGLCPLTVALACTAGLATVSPVSETRGWNWTRRSMCSNERSSSACNRGRERRTRGSSPGSPPWRASAAGSPSCSRDDTPSPSSSAGGTGCGGRAGTIARSGDTYVVFGWSSVGSLRPPMMSRQCPISLPTPARRGRRSRHEEDGFR